MPAIKFGTSALKFGTSALAFGIATAALSEISVSYYPFRSEPYTDLGQGCYGYGEVKVSGANWRTHTLYAGDYLEQDGTCTTLPTGTTQISSTEFLSPGFADNPDYYVGKTIVFERYQGKFIGSGNSYAPSQLGAATLSVDVHLEQEASGNGSQTAFTFTDAAGWDADQIHVYVGGYLPEHKLTGGTDYTVADDGDDLTVTFDTAPASGSDNIFFLLSRKEYALDPASWGSTPPRSEGVFYVVTIGTASAVENYRPLGIFFKDEEARYRSRFTTPRNMFATWFENYYSFAKYMRPMDAYIPMTSNASVPADMALLTDASISTSTLDNHFADFDYAATGVGMRQANPILAHLDYCKNAYAQTRVPHITLPCYFGYPMYVTVQSTTVQTSKASQLGYQWFNPNVVDLGETITASSPSVADVVTIDTANKRIVLDADGNFSHTTNSPEAKFSFTLNFTDVNAISRSIVMKYRVIYDTGNSGQYLFWPDTDDAWISNESYYDGHWCWNQWADWLIDQLVAVDWSETDEVLLELGNEIWNTARRFAAATGYAAGCGTVKAFHESGLSGNGYLAAKFKKRFDDRVTARMALDPGNPDYIAHGYNLTMAIGTWTSVAGYAATSRLEGYSGFWEGTEGGSLTGSPLTAKIAEAQLFMTNYYGQPFVDDASRNMTGLSGSAHVTAITDAFDADEDGFWSDVYDWYAATGAGTDDLTRIIWIENRYDEIQAVCESYGTIVRGCYEGGSHDDSSGIPSGIRSHSGFAASYYSHMQGATGAAIWNLMVTRLRAKDSNFVISAYGGPYTVVSTDFGQPWQYGAYQAALNGYATAIRETA